MKRTDSQLLAQFNKLAQLEKRLELAKKLNHSTFQKTVKRDIRILREKMGYR